MSWFDDVTVLGVEEHCWRHTLGGDKFVTGVIELTPVATGTGPGGCWTWSRDARNRCLNAGSPPVQLLGGPTCRSWRWTGFTGSKTTVAEEQPGAVAVMDPLHVVRLAGEAVDIYRRRVQQATTGQGGRCGDRLFRARRTLLTGADLLTDKQTIRLQDIFSDQKRVEVEATWGIYQHLVQAYRRKDRKLDRHLMTGVIDSIATGVPAKLSELVRLSRP